MTGKLAKEERKNPVAKKIKKILFFQFYFLYLYIVSLKQKVMTLRKVKEVATKYNATIEISYLPGYTLYEAVAPDEFIWNSGDCQIMKVYRDNGTSLSDAYEELIERMEWGIEKEIVLN